jgi:hypothetical protein
MSKGSLKKKLKRSSVANKNEKAHIATSMKKMIHRGMVLEGGNSVLNMEAIAAKSVFTKISIPFGFSQH